MIQISPHTEMISSAPLSGAESPYAATAGIAGAEKSGEGEGAARESQSVFAKILAGLLGKDRGDTAVDLDPDASPASDAGALTNTPADVEAAAGVDAAVAEKSKKTRAGKTAEPAEAGKNAADENAGGALAKTGFSEDEQSPLLGVELLLSRSTEQAAALGEVSLEGEGGVSGEIDGARGASLDEAAGLFAGQDMAAEADWAAEAGAEVIAETGMEAAGDRFEREKAAKEKVSSLSGEAVSGAEVFAGDEKRGLQDMAKQAGQAEQGKNGRGEKSRLEEARGRDRRRDRFSLELRDMRTGAENGGKAGELRFNANAETRGHSGGGTREITLELRLPDYAQDMPRTETAGWEFKSGQAVEDLLARELHQNFNGDIVRHASVALRDGGEGTIKLALKPESLGNVKIRLEMAENKITGHIVVESEEALRAFEREVHSLEQAFRDSGFEAANLQMSLASDNRGADGQWQEAASFLFGEQAASRYDAALDRFEPEIAGIDLYQRGTALINVLA